jgi:DNA polymerase IV
VILHVDMDAFFASVEQRSDPRLLGKPVLVCGDPDGRSVVAAASYEARPYGVRAGMPVGQARRLCPHAELVPGDPSKYVALSHRILDLLKAFSPMVEPMSIDEAFLDLGGTTHDGERAPAAALELQRRIENRFSLTCSVGLGPNKLIAKMGSSLHKPRGFTALTVEQYRKHFWPEPVSALWGIGEQTAAALRRIGIHTLGDLAHAPETLLSATFGVNGPRLRYAARGEDESTVVPYFQGVASKSMGHEHTLERDEEHREALEALIVTLADQVTRRMRKECYLGRTVVLKIRTSDFKTRTRQHALEAYTDEPRTVAHWARCLLRAHWNGRAVRLLGVTMAELVSWKGAAHQPLFASDRRYRKMVKAVDRARDRFGESALLRAVSLRN